MREISQHLILGVSQEINLLSGVFLSCMNILPGTDRALALRTDFSDEATWRSLSSDIQQTYGEFQAYVTLLSNPEYDGATPEQVLAAVPRRWNHTFLFIVDRVALEHREHPILVMDLWAERGRTFRVIPSELWSVENNLSIANMDFAEFAQAVDPDGIFRGFPST